MEGLFAVPAPLAKLRSDTDNSSLGGFVTSALKLLRKVIFVRSEVRLNDLQPSCSAHGDCEELKDRFVKRRDTARPTGRYVPQVSFVFKR